MKIRFTSWFNRGKAKKMKGASDYKKRISAKVGISLGSLGTRHAIEFLWQSRSTSSVANMASSVALMAYKCNTFLIITVVRVIIAAHSSKT